MKACLGKINIKPFYNKRNPKKKKLTHKDKNDVANFYQCDDISRQSPGIKDCIVLWLIEKSEKTKTLFDCLYLKNNAILKSEHPQYRIGKSKFAKLRCNFVLLTSELPRNVCLCVQDAWTFLLAMYSIGSIYITMVFYRYLHGILVQSLDLAKIGCLLVLVSWILLYFEIQVKF